MNPAVSPAGTGLLPHYRRDNPLTSLLELLWQRKGYDRALLLSGALAALLLTISDSEARWAALGLILPPVYAMLRAATDVSLLVAWRRGGNLSETLLAGLPPAQLVDGAVCHSLRMAWRHGVPYTLGYLALVARSSDQSFFYLGFAQLPVLLLMVWLCGNLAAWSGSGAPTGWWIPGVASLLVSTLAGALFGCPMLSIACLILVVPVAGLGSRSSAADGLGDQEPPPALPQFSRTPNTWLRPWSENPIVVREARREARCISGGKWDALAARHGAVILLLGIILSLDLWSGNALRFEMDGLLALGLFSFLQPFRAMARVSGCLVAERERGTLASLAVTSLSAEEFVDGWAQVGWRPRMIENLVAGAFLAALVAFGHLATPSTPPGGCSLRPLSGQELLCAVSALALGLGTYTVLGAYLGVAASALARTRAALPSSCFVLSACVALGVLLLGPLVPALGPFWPGLAGALAAAALRAMAVGNIKVSRRI